MLFSWLNKDKCNNSSILKRSKINSGDLYLIRRISRYIMKTKHWVDDTPPLGSISPNAIITHFKPIQQKMQLCRFFTIVSKQSSGKQSLSIIMQQTFSTPEHKEYFFNVKRSRYFPDMKMYLEFWLTLIPKKMG